jgi:hypothetical protein
LLLLAAAGLWQVVAAAAHVLAELLPMLLATQQQQQQAPAIAASIQPTTSINEQVLSSAAFVSRCLVELFKDLVTVAATIPSAAAAAAGRNERYDYCVMLKDRSMLAAVAPMAELVLALLRTPLSSSSNSSRASSSSSTIIPQEAVVVRTIQDRRMELNVIIATAAQLAAAFVDPPMNVQQPAAISQLLMVNLAYTALYERSEKRTNSRRRQQQQLDEPASSSQLLVALGLPAEDVNEQIGTSPILPSKGDMRRLRSQIETALFAMHWGFVDIAYDGSSDDVSEESEDSASSSSSAAAANAGPGSGSSIAAVANARPGSSLQQRQQQRHVDAAGKHIVPAGVHEPLSMTVLDAILSKNFVPDIRMRFSLLMTATGIAGFAMVLLPDAEPQASAKAAKAAAAAADKRHSRLLIQATVRR